MGQKVLELLEAYARDMLKAKRLVLRVRTFNRGMGRPGPHSSISAGVRS